MKKISTSKLANKLNINSKELFITLQEIGLIFNENNNWKLTQKGIDNGGVIIKSFKFSDYIAWDEDFNPIEKFKLTNIKYLSSTELSEILNTSSRKFNIIISELGFIEKNIKGWGLTNVGKLLGGKEFTHKSGRVYVKWPEELKENKMLLDEFSSDNTQKFTQEITENTNNIIDNFRDKFPTKYRTKDGHSVRSRGELIIDNILYEYGLVHAYERKLPVEENIYCDFYIPSRLGASAVYIEYWGLEDGEYNERKAQKKEIYKKYNLNLIELENKHIDNLDDYLPKMLLDFGIKVD